VPHERALRTASRAIGIVVLCFGSGSTRSRNQRQVLLVRGRSSAGMAVIFPLSVPRQCRGGLQLTCKSAVLEKREPSMILLRTGESPTSRPPCPLKVERRGHSFSFKQLFPLALGLHSFPPPPPFPSKPWMSTLILSSKQLLSTAGRVLLPSSQRRIAVEATCTTLARETESRPLG